METQVRAERAYREAMEIIDREWLEAGMSQEELDRGEQIAELLDRLVASGRSMKDILAEWQGKSSEDILREYATPTAF